MALRYIETNAIGMRRRICFINDLVAIITHCALHGAIHSSRCSEFTIL